MAGSHRRDDLTADELMAELEADPEWVQANAARQRERRARGEEFISAAAPVLQALEAAGIDTTDFGRFVNRPVPGVLEPAVFDAERAAPILLEWLPRVDDRGVKDAIVRYLKARATRGVAVEALIAEFHRADNELRWVIGDTLQRIATANDYAQIVELASDTRFGSGRAQLVDMLWRIKTPEARACLERSIADPDVALVAGSALRRVIGNAAAIERLQPLVDHQDARVATAARENVKRAKRALARSARRSGSPG